MYIDINSLLTKNIVEKPSTEKIKKMYPSKMYNMSDIKFEKMIKDLSLDQQEKYRKNRISYKQTQKVKVNNKRSNLLLIENKLKPAIISIIDILSLYTKEKRTMLIRDPTNLKCYYFTFLIKPVTRK